MVTIGAARVPSSRLDVIDDLLDARDKLQTLLDQALPALEARPRAEAAEILAVLLVAPLRRTGPTDRMRRLVVRGIEARGTAVAASVLEAVAALADADTARRATDALERLQAGGVTPAIEGIGAMGFERGWTLAVPEPAEALAAVVRRPGEPHPRLLKLWLEPGDERSTGLFAGGWTDPFDGRRLEKERDRFAKAGRGELGPELDADGVANAVDALVRRAGELQLPLAEGVALVIAQLRRAAGGPEWPAFDVVATPQQGSARPGRR
jgi:hypothetical protein